MGGITFGATGVVWHVFLFFFLQVLSTIEFAEYEAGSRWEEEQR